MTVLVIDPTFLGVRQNVVGLGGFLEFFFGGLVTGVAVGMELKGQLAIGLFQLRVAGLAADAENFVVVAFIAHAQS